LFLAGLVTGVVLEFVGLLLLSKKLLPMRGSNSREAVRETVVAVKNPGGQT